ncbi:recombinase family protein [Anaerobacillus sp. HL2]|nr:recombinase family protein [Anaerobacillus sp. HL2]
MKNTHPAIISEETFEAVQQEIKRRSLMMRDPDKKYRQHFSSHSPFLTNIFAGNGSRPVIRRRLTSSRKGKVLHFCLAMPGDRWTRSRL